MEERDVGLQFPRDELNVWYESVAPLGVVDGKEDLAKHSVVPSVIVTDRYLFKYISGFLNS